jgi:D-alanyl-D-alanine carboxypeptidase (penicillin-binding protein 5/6)
MKNFKRTRKNAKRIFSAFLLFSVMLSLLSIRVNASPATENSLSFDCKSAILMEANTGEVLYENSADMALPPASVTKVMTLLLVMEAIESGKINYADKVRASKNACSMGGSQIYLEENEEMTVEDLVKSVVIASANDAAVALSEYVSGTEEAFVARMNERAAELGMKNTHFENTNGLDDSVERHLTSAHDIAIMSRELIKYPRITEFSSIWMDTIRNGEFGLTNTNRLIRYYKGATGLKTGSTSKAGFCISATAERDGMTLICVIMGAPSRDIRNAAATSLLDWGFSNYGLYRTEGEVISDIPVEKGTVDMVSGEYSGFSRILKKDGKKNIEKILEIPNSLSAPIKKGDVIGKVLYKLDGKEIGCADIIATREVEEISFGKMFVIFLEKCAQII